jgi:hypothetical protein
MTQVVLGALLAASLGVVDADRFQATALQPLQSGAPNSGGGGSALRNGGVRRSTSGYSGRGGRGVMPRLPQRTNPNQVQVFKVGGGAPGNGASAGLVPPVTSAARGAPNTGENAIPGESLPPLVLRALEAGPLTPGQARALVELLVRSARPAAASPESDGALARPADPDLLALGRSLDGGGAPKTSEDDPAAPVDGEQLRRWFAEIDRSMDASITYLEWRDRTASTLDAFRVIDANHDGRLSFEEFARPLVVNEASSGGRGVDPALLEWALADESVAAGEGLAGTDLSKLSQDQLLALARAQIAADAARRAAQQAMAHARKDAAAPEPAGSAAKPAPADGAAVPIRRSPFGGPTRRG